jgi:hypothetical protein
MNLINRYRIIIAVVLPLLILLALRTCTNCSFKYDAKRWAGPSFDFSNIISETGIDTIPGEKLIINLDITNSSMVGKAISEVHIPPDSILNSKYLKKIRDHKGPVLLSSADPALSARLWMVISQTGCRNIYILTGSNDNEVFKNEFRPDTLVRPEQ